MASPELLTRLLREVSRSFYLTLRVLPGAIRPQIGLAYLLARATDTIADTEIVPAPERLASLQALRESILGQQASPPDFTPFTRPIAGGPRHASRDAERILLTRIPEALAVLREFSADDQARLRAVLDTITSGQELDVRRFGSARAGQIIALASKAEFEDYTYRVAGCVGEFWTRLCRAHLFPQAPVDEAKLLAQGVRLGRGLQMVNILRDLPADLRAGRCYLPEQELKSAGLVPSDLLRPESEAHFRPQYDALLDEAQGHLAAGWDYTNALPREQKRVRLACAWPVLIGAQTVQRLRAGRVLDGAARIKVSRGEVRAILWQTLWKQRFPRAWNGLFAAMSGRKP